MSGCPDLSSILPMAINANSATVANGGKEIVDISREADRNKLIFCLFYYLILNLLMANLANPCCRGSRGGVCSTIKTMPLERQRAPLCLGCLCAVCFISQKPSEQEFFVPAKIDLAVKLLCRNRQTQTSKYLRYNVAQKLNKKT
jgi:hypothetical protein